MERLKREETIRGVRPNQKRACHARTRPTPELTDLVHVHLVLERVRDHFDCHVCVCVCVLTADCARKILLGKDYTCIFCNLLFVFFFCCRRVVVLCGRGCFTVST